MIKTRRHPLKFYLTLLFAFLVFAGVGFVLFLISFDNQKDSTAPKAFSILVGTVFILVAIYTVIKYFRNAPIIIANKEQISFGKSIFYWKDISTINLSGKQPFRYFFPHPLEGCKLVFNDGKVKYIFDSLYSNSAELKSFIQGEVIHKKVPIRPILKVEDDEVDGETFDYFKGNQFLSMRGIMLWGILGFFAYLFLFNDAPLSFMVSLVLGCYSLFWFFFNSYLMHYVGLSDKFLSIKNHNHLWINRLYRIEDIKEIVFETYGKMPDCLRVITKDFKSKLYPAGTLKEKTWLELQETLREKGVIVRNELNH